jgi:hypothetical protein
VVFHHPGKHRLKGRGAIFLSKKSVSDSFAYSIFGVLPILVELSGKSIGLKAKQKGPNIESVRFVEKLWLKVLFADLV